MNKFQQKIIKDAIDDPEPLSDWEHDFVQSIADRDDDYELTAKQSKIVNRIGQKYL